MQTIELTLPTYFANWLVNGDMGDLTEAETETLDMLLLANEVAGDALNMEHDTHFTRFHDARGWGIADYACDCATYVFPA